MSFLKFIMTIGLATYGAGIVWAGELPTPEKLKVDYSHLIQKVSVVEPHESTSDHGVVVDYEAVPLTNLLTIWFGDRWKDEDAEIEFFAQDGYRSVIASSKLKKYNSFLAFARNDGSAFVVDNIGQNQQHIALGPYYLIWNNIDHQELLRQGAYGWPYQIQSIDLRRKSQKRMLLPGKSSRTLEHGLADTQEYCMTCHHIQGIGGKKYPLDLLTASCRWPDADLKSWIESPSRFKPGTSMPPLGRMLPIQERRQIIGRIVNYLHAMKTERTGICRETNPRH